MRATTPVLVATQHDCKCGGVLIVDEKHKRTLHSLPTCDAYDELTRGARFEGIGFSFVQGRRSAC